MASLWKRCCRLLLLLLALLLRLQPSTCLDREPADSVAVSPVHGLSLSPDEGIEQGDGGMRREEGFLPADHPFRRLLQPYGWPPLHSPDRWRRKLLQTAGAAVPFPPLQVLSNGKPCILFRVRKLWIRYLSQKQLDLSRAASAPHLDTRGSVCSKDRATLVMRFGDVEDLRGLSIRLQLSSSFYESSGQRWFSVDGVSLLYNVSEEAAFNASELFAPSSSSYHCLHVSSLQRRSGLLQPSSERARRWTVSFTDFQIQAFDVASGRFSTASDCATFLTPAILMGLVTSLILLLVLAYALHMVIHLKHIERYDERKAAVYLPRSPERPERCSVADGTAAEKNTLECY